MKLYTKDTRLADVIFEHPSALTVAGRFGINPGVGEHSIGSICETHGIDASFFLAILNTYLHEDYFPVNVLKSFSISLILDYLTATNEYYSRVQLPNIERHFRLLINHSAATGNLRLLHGFFNEMKQELNARISFDNERRFPAIRMLDAGKYADPMLARTSDSDALVEDKTSDLLRFFVVHLSGDYDRNLCHAVVNAVFTLDKDIRQNNRIRDRILRPMTESLLARSNTL